MITNPLDKSTILSNTNNGINIYLHYLGLSEFPNKNISSPYAKDNNPSFRLYKNGTFKCYSTGKQGDVFQFVAELKGLDCENDFSEVLKTIQSDMFLYDNGIAKQNKPSIAKQTAKALQTLENKEKPTILDIKCKTFTDEHLNYWFHLGVSKEVLEQYKVKALQSYFFDYGNKKSKVFSTDSFLAFAYEVDDFIEIYIPNQPEKNKKKFFSKGVSKNYNPESNQENIFGLEQLPKEQIENLIICAGKKDTIVAVSRGFYAITFQSEAINPTKEQIELLQNHCKNLLICYDNDKGGQAGTKRITGLFTNVIPISFPNEYNDITDYFQDKNKEDFQQLIDIAVKEKSIAIPNVYDVAKELQEPKYELPKEVKTPLSELLPDIEKYGLFQAENKIWVLTSNKHFKAISNFFIEIIQHMNDEKVPLKLIRIRNTRKEEVVFDVPSKELNTKNAFENVVTSQGNYFFNGTTSELDKLKNYLFDKMGIGKKIDSLGWQEDGKFWLWNNKVNLCNGESLSIDENGIFKHKGTCYYIPSANKKYEHNQYKYVAQKQMRVLQSDIDIKVYLSKMYEVYGKHFIPSILFTLSSVFQDVIIQQVNGFPILFLQGEASSGKDNLSFTCRSFFGVPQSTINLGGNTSTKVAHIRELSQFSNIICEFSEYEPKDTETTGRLKGIWDRNGYKRGNIDSHSSVENLPILSSLILTSNNIPTDEALITRFIWLDMNKNKFTEEERQKYEELKEITKKGISSFTDDILKYREDFKNEFGQFYKNYKEIISQGKPNAQGRFQSNFGILGATYKYFAKHLQFPFTEDEMISHFYKMIDFQMNKINSASQTNKWWDCFLVCMKLHNENRIDYSSDFKIDGSEIAFNFTSIYSKIQRQWFNQYKENIPNKSEMKERLKRDISFVETKDSFRIATGTNPTSVLIFHISKLSLSEEIQGAYDNQRAILKN